MKEYFKTLPNKDIASVNGRCDNSFWKNKKLLNTALGWGRSYEKLTFYCNIQWLRTKDPGDTGENTLYLEHNLVHCAECMCLDRQTSDLKELIIWPGIENQDTTLCWPEITIHTNKYQSNDPWLDRQVRQRGRNFEFPFDRNAHISLLTDVINQSSDWH